MEAHREARSCILGGMYRVQYFCPRQSPYWQTSQGVYGSFQTAATWCQMVKPPQGQARVIDQYGQVVYAIY